MAIGKQTQRNKHLQIPGKHLSSPTAACHFISAGYSQSHHCGNEHCKAGTTVITWQFLPVAPSLSLLSSIPAWVLHRLQSLQVHLLQHRTSSTPLTLARPPLPTFFLFPPLYFLPLNMFSQRYPPTLLVGSALAYTGSCHWCSWN